MQLKSPLQWKNVLDLTWFQLFFVKNAPFKFYALIAKIISM